ncbi:MAG: DUF669 domain-containing protein [Pirellulales bacterium]
MANLQGFDANQVEPRVEFEPVPAGQYLAAIVESEMKPTRQRDGSFLEFKFEILEGEYKGRKVWARLNLENSNQKAVEIARAELSSICRAANVLQPRDSVELHNLPLLIKVACKKREDTGEITNEIKGYARREAASGVPQQAATNVAPWRR